MPIPRRHVLAAAGAALVTGVTSRRSADAASVQGTVRPHPAVRTPRLRPATTSAVPAPMVGFSVSNQVDGTLVPFATFAADVDRIVEIGGDSIRMSLPLYLVGGVFGGTWYPFTGNLDALAEQVGHARSRGLKVCMTLSNPVSDPSNPTFTRSLAVNRQAVTAVAQRIGTQVAVWQLMNEWNTSHYATFAPLTTPLSSAYLDEVRQVLDSWSAVIRGRSARTVITSALGGYPADQARWLQWEQIYARTGSSLDAWGVNAYPDPNVPAAWPALAQWVRHMRATSGKPVVVLETGVSTPTPESAAAAVTALPAILRGLGQGAPLAIFSYQLRDRDSAGASWEDHFGVVTSSGAHKAHWAATRDAVASLRASHRAP